MLVFLFFFFFNDTATTEIYTLSLHDALPICPVDEGYPQHHEQEHDELARDAQDRAVEEVRDDLERVGVLRSEEHTSELQSRQYLVCRLLLEKKKKTHYLYEHNDINSVTISSI